MPSSDTKLQGGAVWAASLQSSSNVAATAAGTTQATAAAIASDLTVFTTVAASAGARLPAAGASDDFVVVNGGANALTLYPPVGSKINNGTVNAGVSIPVGKAAHAFFGGGGQVALLVSA